MATYSTQGSRTRSTSLRFLGAAWLLTLGSARIAPAQQAAVLVEIGDPWRYFKGTVAPPADWNTSAFDDSKWLEGPTGIGYGDGDDTTVLDDMLGGYVAFFARRAFTVGNPATVERMILSVDYDDGFAAYLNGTEIRRQELPAAPAQILFDTPATAAREAGAAIDVEIPVSSIQPGKNVLAIELHNVNLTSSDASLIPRLIANADPPPSGLTCAVAGNAVTLDWVNNGTYDGIRVERDGARIATLPADATTYTDAAFDGFARDYRVLSVEGTLEFPCPVCRVGCALAAPTCTLALVGGKTQATVAWGTVPAGVQTIAISRQGGAPTTLDPTSTQYVDPDVESVGPQSSTDYTVTFTGAGGRACAVACSASLCPQDLTARVTGKEVRLEWGNIVKNWDHLEMSRDGVVVDAAISGTAASWIDGTLDLTVGESHSYVLHPVAASGGELPAPGTQCDLSSMLAYAPEVASYAPPPGGWDYLLDFGGMSKPLYTESTGEKGNLDGQWIRAIGRDLWDGSAPLEVGPAPEGPAPGGLDVVGRNGLGPCGTDTRVLRLLDPGDPHNAIGTEFPTPFDEPNNARIFLGFDTGVKDRNLLKSGVTFAARLRTSPDAPAYMNPAVASGDGGPIHNGKGHVGIYWRPTGGAAGANVGAAFAVNSGAGGGDLEISTVPLKELAAIGVKNYLSIWMTVVEGATHDTYDVSVYVNGSLKPSSQLSGTQLSLDAGTGDFGPEVSNYLAIGSDDTGADAMIEIDYVAYKGGVFVPTVASTCGGTGDGSFRRGDTNDDGSANITDGIYTLNFLFLGGDEPVCLDSADTNDDGTVNITDGITLLNYLFLGGPPPSAPGPEECGPDDAEDELAACESTRC